MKTQTRNLLLGGAVVLGGALCGWYLYGKSQPIKESKPISKELLIQILKDQERESYPIFKCTCSIFMEILKQYKETKSNIDIPFENLKQSVFMQCRPTSICLVIFHIDPIEEKVSDSLKTILKKYGISEKEFWNASEVTFKDDKDILRMNQTYWENFEKACRGIPPQFSSTVPELLTPGKTLQIRAKLLKQEAENIQKIFEPIDEEGRAFWEDQERVFSFVSSARVDLAINAEQREILVAEGLGAFEEAPEQVFDGALFKYLSEDSEFKQKFQDLERERVHFVKELGKRKLQYAA